MSGSLSVDSPVDAAVGKMDLLVELIKCGFGDEIKQLKEINPTDTDKDRNLLEVGNVGMHLFERFAKFLSHVLEAKYDPETMGFVGRELNVCKWTRAFFILNKNEKHKLSGTDAELVCQSWARRQAEEAGHLWQYAYRSIKRKGFSRYIHLQRLKTKWSQLKSKSKASPCGTMSSCSGDEVGLEDSLEHHVADNSIDIIDSSDDDWPANPFDVFMSDNAPETGELDGDSLSEEDPADPTGSATKLFELDLETIDVSSDELVDEKLTKLRSIAAAGDIAAHDAHKNERVKANRERKKGKGGKSKKGKGAKKKSKKEGRGGKKGVDCKKGNCGKKSAAGSGLRRSRATESLPPSGEDKQAPSKKSAAGSGLRRSRASESLPPSGEDKQAPSKKSAAGSGLRRSRATDSLPPSGEDKQAQSKDARTVLKKPAAKLDKDLGQISKMWHAGSGDAECPDGALVQVRDWVEHRDGDKVGKRKFQLLYEKNVIVNMTAQNFGDERASRLMALMKDLFLRGFSKEQLQRLKEEVRSR